MTTLLTEPGSDNLWASMPGWGIVADLTPPEIVTARGLRTLRKQLGAVLILVLLLCAAGYVWAGHQVSTENDRLAASRATTSRLAAENARFSTVVALQAAADSISTQVSALMATDVDAAAFVEHVLGVAPAGTTFTSLAVTLSADGGDGTPGGTGSEPVIGTLTISGTSRRMIDVASYATALQGLTGVVNVIPATNSASTAGGPATWSITAQLTDTLYTHRFKASSTATGSTGGH